MRRSVRSAAFTMVAVLVGLILVSCGGDDDGGGDASGDPTAGNSSTTLADSSDEPQRGGEIVVAVEAETPGFDPPNGLIGNSGRVVNRAIYGGLTAAKPDGSYAPYLAESVTSNDDATEWTITLREGITFHDETPMDAEAVKFSMDRVIAPEAAVASGHSYIDSVEVVDPLTVKLTLNEPRATVPQVLTDGLGNIVSPTAVQEMGDDFNSHPVGAGPYAFVEWVRDDHLTMERYDGFFLDDMGFADTIVIRPIPDEAARSAALRAGDVDVIVTQNASDILSFRDDDAYEVVEIPFGANGLYINHERPPLDDIRIRTAIDQALDKQAIIDLVWSGVGEPTSTPFAPDSFWINDSIEPLPHDSDEAATLIEEYEQETGQQVAFEILSGPGATDQNFAQAVHAQLGDVGIDVTIGNTADQNTLVSRLIDGDFDVTTRVHGGFIDPWFEMTRLHMSDGLLNIANFGTSEMDALLTLAQNSTDQDERKDAYDRVQEILAENLDGVYVRTSTYAIIMESDIHGYDGAVLPDGSPSLGQYFTPVLVDSLWRES